jgi:hypothetical protein
MWLSLSVRNNSEGDIPRVRSLIQEKSPCVHHDLRYGNFGSHHTSIYTYKTECMYVLQSSGGIFFGVRPVAVINKIKYITCC